jgi:hypothetical protein
MEQTREDLGTRRQSGPVVYCVVPPRLARIKPRLCEHFAGDSTVEVVIDQRTGERRAAPAGSDVTDQLAGRLVPGIERRTIDGRRTSTPVGDVFALPAELRRYEKDLRFLAGPGWAANGNVEAKDGWERRCLEAEQQAAELAGTLVATADALRTRRGLSPRSFVELLRAEAAVERFRRWLTDSKRPA